MPDLLKRQIPPAEGFQFLDGLLVKAPADRFGRNAAHDSVGLHVFGDDGPRADDRSVADMYAGQDHRLVPDPDVAADHDIPFIVPCGGDL